MKKGAKLFVFVVYLGCDTNNAIKLDGMIKGLSMDIHLNFRNSIVERDSVIIIQVLFILLFGSNLNKVSTN
jgi:hypothetical protein